MDENMSDWRLDFFKISVMSLYSFDKILCLLVCFPSEFTTEVELSLASLHHTDQLPEVTI